MPLVFRKVRKARWDKDKLDFDWLVAGEFPGDPLGDLSTKNGALSIYVINDDRSNLERVAAAIAANGDSLSSVDYALVNLKIIESQGFKVREERGVTPDKMVNQWHCDIVELSAPKVLELAECIWNDTEAKIERILEKKILNLIVDGVSSDYLDREKIRIKSEELWRRLDQ